MRQVGARKNCGAVVAGLAAMGLPLVALAGPWDDVGRSIGKSAGDAFGRALNNAVSAPSPQQQQPARAPRLPANHAPAAAPEQAATPTQDEYAVPSQRAPVPTAAPAAAPSTSPVVAVRPVTASKPPLQMTPPPPSSASASNGPFNRLTMGAYFNAIYAGDFDEVRRQDRQILGQLTSNITGAFGNNPIWKNIVGAMQLDSASLINSAVKEYAGSYGNSYEKCLRKDSVTLTMRMTTTSSRYGVVNTSDTDYRMNPEFARPFKLTAEGEPETVGTAIGDSMYGNPLGRTQAGVREIMASFRCDDPVIKTFETNLLQMFATLRSQPAAASGRR